MDHLGETYPPGPTREFPNSLLESHHRFRRQAPLRLFMIREAESQEFPFPWSSHRTLLPVHSQLKLRCEESRHASHHSFAGSPTADVNVAVIRMPHEAMYLVLLGSDAQVHGARLVAEQVDLLRTDEISLELEVGRGRVGGQEVVLRVTSRAIPADIQR